jgi:glycosyltransferase involved in cell wall biosynthesis
MPHGAPTVAIAHDYLTQRGGAERVVLAMLRAFPEATVYTTLYDPNGTYPEFKDVRIVTSPLNRFRFLRKNHRAALPLLAWAARRMRIDADVLLVSSSGWAHGFPTSGYKLVYCHAPARWLYQTDTYLGYSAMRSPKGAVVTALKPWLRRWDRRAAVTADRYLTNSTVVRQRVLQTYGIDATVLPAPHGITDGHLEPIPEVAGWSSYYLVVSRLLPYKNVDAVIAAFAEMPDERLLVVGAGPEEDRLRRIAPSNVRLAKQLTDAQMRWAYAHSTALVAPSIEDYGLTPLEAGAFGRPTVALRGGGYLDTVAEGLSGLFFDAATPEAIRSAVRTAYEHSWDEVAIGVHVEQFGEQQFRAALQGAVAELLPAPALSSGLPSAVRTSPDLSVTP